MREIESRFRRSSAEKYKQKQEELRTQMLSANASRNRTSVAPLGFESYKRDIETAKTLRTLKFLNINPNAQMVKRPLT